MANIDDFNASLDALRAIPEEKIVEPNLPVDIYLQESENLKQWSVQDAAVLATIGITRAKIDELSVRAGACREAQSVWYKDQHSQQEAQRKWGIQSPLAFNLRDELVHTFRYAYRADVSLSARVAGIAEGNTNADMIQDLNDLAVLGRNNTAPLAAIGFNLALLDQAANTADTMANLLALANGDKAFQNESKQMRDRAYTYLKELVDEIREAGKYLFWRTPKRFQGYVSKYWASQGTQSPVEPTPVE
jgi:hypothetical protein